VQRGGHICSLKKLDATGQGIKQRIDGALNFTLLLIGMTRWSHGISGIASLSLPLSASRASGHTSSSAHPSRGKAKATRKGAGCTRADRLPNLTSRL
jgi:hypothetical protein